MKNNDDLIKFILTQFKANKIEEKIAITIMEKLAKNEKQNDEKAIAIVGMDCRLPGADNVAEYWRNLVEGKNSIASFPKNRRKDIDLFLSDDVLQEQEDIYALGGYLNEIDMFDGDFFRISPREASLMEPCQRLALESAYRALEEANVLGAEGANKPIGVYVGLDSTDILQYSQMIEAVGLSDILSTTGSLTSIIAGRISYTMGLNGPGMVIDTACSSGLVAVIEACKALNNNDCSVALAGGCNIMVAPLKEKKMLEIESESNEVRAFDKKACGTIFSEGVCFVALKKLDAAISDKDAIYGVIRAGTVNSDGASSGLTAPNPDAQVMLYQKAWEDAGINPETISYIEAHGTGTLIGDSIELESITSAFRKYTEKKGFCGVGSVKSNIGHTKGAAGIASLIKVVMALKNRIIPASINFESPNPHLKLDDSPVYINNRHKKWELDYPLRAGVSSFGFSGTNAHLVVEEFKESYDKKVLTDDLALFTVSSKNEQSLKAIIRSYIEFLDEKPNSSLQNICYTANVCRPDFAYRIIMLVKSITDLREKLANVVSNLATFKEQNIFYGVCPEKSKKKKDTEPSESYQLAEILKKDSEKKQAHFKTICEHYIRGKLISWQNLYPKKMQKVHLPGYPFNKKRVWIDTTGYKKEEVKQDRLYPLVDELLINTHDQAIYKTRLSISTHWQIAEHKIFERYVLPGTTLIDMVAYVGVSQWGKNNFCFKDLLFLQTISLDVNESLDLFIVVKKSQEKMEFQIISKQDIESPDFTLHMKGMLVFSSTESRDKLQSLPIKTALKESINSYRFDDSKENSELVLGPRWRVNGTVYQGKDELLAEIEIPPEYQDELIAYSLYPSLMDVAINYVVGVLRDDIYVPFSIKEFHLYGEMSSKIWSYVTRVDREGQSDEIIYVDIALINDRGEIFAYLQHYAIKKLRSENLDICGEGFFKKFFYRTRWLPGEDSAGVIGDLSKEKILFIRKNDSFSVNLVKACKTTKAVVTEAVLGEFSFSCSTDNLIFFNGSSENYNRLMEWIKENKITKIVHMTTLLLEGRIGEYDKLADFENELKYGLVNLCYLVQSLINARVGWQVEIVLLTNNASLVTGEEKVVYPLNGAYQGSAGVIARENSNILCRAIDIDQFVQKERIINQIFNGTKKFKVALRGDKVFVPEITNKFDNLHGSDKAVSLKHDGVYLITGGMGGIGKEVLKHLSRLTNVSLIIIGRTVLAEPSRIAKNDEYTKKTEFLNQLRSEGNSVEYFGVNVSDYQGMKKCFSYIKNKYGKLDGIFHCAGIPGDKFLYNKSIDEFLEVISPKILGTFIIDRLTRSWEPDFILLFSSLTTIIVPPGQMDYAAANSYLNSYAEKACLKGQNIKNILWPAWKGAGMAFQANGNSNEGLNFGFLKAISIENALKAMEKVLESNIQTAIICELDFSYKYCNDLRPYGFSLDKILEDQFIKKQTKEFVKAEKKTSISLTGKEIFTSTEQLVGEIWGKILGLTVLDVMADFHQLGGDSIHSIQIANEINKSLNLKLDIVHIFDYPSVSELSGYLDSSVANLPEELEQENNAGEIHKYNLSEVQLRIWFIQKLFPYITIYNLPMIIKLDFPIEPILIEKTINIIIKRHSVFRTLFKEKDNVVQQIILDDHSLALGVVDFSRWSTEQETVEKKIHTENNKPFDFSRPLILAKLYRIKKNFHYLYINVHHLICDGWSSKLFYNELMNIYQNISAGKEVDSSEKTPRYVDWIADMEEWKRSINYLEQKEYWENELSGSLPVIDLPLDNKRPEKFSYKGDTYIFLLNNELWQKIKKLSALLNYTVHTLMQAFFFLFLNMITGDEDIILGIPAAGRDDTSFEKVIGVFINTLCIRLKWRGLNSLADLLAEIKNKNHGALRNGRMPFADLVGIVNPERNMSTNPIFSVFYQYYENLPPVNEGTSQFDLSLYCKDEKDIIYCRFEYNTDLFNKETIQEFSNIFEGIVNVVTDLLDTKGTENNKKTVREKAKISLSDTYLLLAKEIVDECLKIRIQEKYWRKKLADEWPDLSLPYDYHLLADRRYDWDTKSFEVDESLMLQMKNTCTHENIPLSLFILAVNIVVLSKYGKHEEIMVGTCFLNDFSTNILPIRIHLDNQSSFSMILREVEQFLGRARLYGEYPFKKMTEIAMQEQSRLSFFDTIFVYDEDMKTGIDSFPTKKGEPCPGNPDIVFVCKNTGKKLQLEIRYCTELFKEITIQRLSGHILLGLKEFSLNFDQNTRIPGFITADETIWIADVINNTSATYAKDKTLVNLFRAQVDKNAEKTALVFEDKRMTYLELNENANKLAHYLVENGVGSDKVVGVMLKRSLEMVIAILGILKSGGTYLPIDVNTPRDRIEYILGHAGADVLLVSEKKSGSSGLYKEILIESPAITEGSTDDLPVQITPVNIAYIIYTSGSTGKPKGVMVSHKNVNNFLNWAIKNFSFNETDRLMLVTSISFDISVLEIFGALLSGAELHIISRELLYNPSALGSYCQKTKITIWHSVPSLMVQYLSDFDDEHKEAFEIKTLRHVMLGGEAWSKDLARKIRKIFGNVQITNLYGPTETTIWVTSHNVGEQELRDNTILPIGTPIFNNQVYILDDVGKQCGIGIPGDIYINGDSVTQGYYKNDEKTKENFTLHPQYGNLYRTGDLGKYSSNGTILFLGREDNQVKVRGYRIELGEIESAMLEYDPIKEVAVTARKAEESNRLVCFYVSNEEQSTDRIRKHLQLKLPEYMVPSQFIHLAHMPLTSNGKIDRKKLLGMEITERPLLDGEYASPVTEIETFLAGIWKSLLNIKRVGVYDNFFAIGGDSFLANRMHAKIEEKYPDYVTIVDIFTYPTIAKLSEYVQGKNGDGTESSQSIAKEMENLFLDMEKGEIDLDEAIRKINEMN